MRLLCTPGNRDTTEQFVIEAQKDVNVNISNLLLMSLYPLDLCLKGRSERWVNTYLFQFGSDAIHHPISFTLQRLI